MVRLIFDKKTMALKSVVEWESPNDVPISALAPMLWDECLKRYGKPQNEGKEADK